MAKDYQRRAQTCAERIGESLEKAYQAGQMADWIAHQVAVNTAQDPDSPGHDITIQGTPGATVWIDTGTALLNYYEDAKHAEQFFIDEDIAEALEDAIRANQ